MQMPGDPTFQLLASIETELVDIHSGSPWPSRSLSNFAPWAFTLDGIRCSSIEGFLQGMKFEDPARQAEICGMVGLAAKGAGRNRNAAWQVQQVLWWRGQAIDRHGPAYARLLDRGYAAMNAANPGFGEALLATGEKRIMHSIGTIDPRRTVLTKEEFCSRLTRIRAWLRKRMNEAPPPGSEISKAGLPRIG